jgi:hypothetical protein
VYGVKAAVRRLPFAPDPKQMEVTSVEQGRLVFTPLPGKPVSLADLRRAVTKAGYEIEGARLMVAGLLAGEDRLRVPESGQVFRLAGDPALRDLRARTPDGAGVTVEGVWEVADGEQLLRLDAPRPAEGGP